MFAAPLAMQLPRGLRNSPERAGRGQLVSLIQWNRLLWYRQMGSV